MQQQLAPPAGSEWRLWIERILLFLGVAQIIAGIFFFFAYNWDDLSRWQKLGITQGFVVLSAVGARFAGLDSLIGKLLLLTAGALVGATFAVYGQIYQTGADAFELFANWAAVILGWVLIARFAAFWILWALIVNIAHALYLDTVTDLVTVEQTTLLGLLNAGFLVLHEVAKPRFAWLADPWSRRVVMAACLLLLATAAANFIDDIALHRWQEEAVTPLHSLAMPAFLVAALLSYGWSRGPGRDLIGLFLVVLAVSGVTWYAALRTIDELLDWEDSDLLVMAAITVVISGLAGWWLHRSWLLLEGAEKTEAGRNDA